MAADDPVWFTEKAYETLKEIVEDYFASAAPTLGRSDVPRKPNGPEVYVALTPADGIPALAEEPGTGSPDDPDRPASVECKIYRRLPNAQGIQTLVPAGFTRFISNLSETDVSGGKYVIVERDKFGTWWTGGGGVGVGRLTFVSNVCPLLSDTLTIGGLINIVNPPVQIGETVEYTTVDLSTGEILAVECRRSPTDCCGSITGTGTGGGGVITDCCPSGMPLDICVTLGNVSGCSCLAGTYTLSWYSGSTWLYDRGGPCGSDQLQMGLTCSVDGSGNTHWRLSLQCVIGTGTTSLVWLASGGATFCLPITFEAVASTFTYTGGFIPPACCDAGSTMTATVAECGGGGQILTPCCPDGLPTVMFVTLIRVSGGSCLAGTYPVVWDGLKWAYGGTGCGGKTVSITVNCTFPHLAVVVRCGADTRSTTTISCTLPISFASNVSNFTDCGAGEYSVTLTD